MKTNSTFKLPKELKRILSTIDDVQRRSSTKKLFIESQVTFTENKNKRFREKNNIGGDE